MSSGISNVLSEQLKRINDVYKRNDKNKSLTEIIEEFQQISTSLKDYNDNKEKYDLQYSSYNFYDCTNDERISLYNNELQFIDCLVTNSIYDKTGITWNWGQIFKLLQSDKSYKGVEKINRKVVYSTSMNNRPIGENSYGIWNGLQIIDLDIKNAELSDKLKPLIFNDLCKYNWFLGVCKSASGRGLHVWTKITPLSIELSNRKVEYICNFRHKYSFVYITLERHAAECGYLKDDILQFVDMAMCRPQQGIFITSDPTAMLNMNFHDLRLDVNFEQAYNTGVESIDWISHPALKQIFSKLDFFVNDKFNSDTNIDVADVDISEPRDVKRGARKHYKHNQRWQLANTLTSLYGADKAFTYMMEICKNTSPRELKGDVKTASIHNKPISLWAVNELNKFHGFKIKIHENEHTETLNKINDEIKKDENVANDPIRILNARTQKVDLHLNYNQYLSDIKDDIMSNLAHITLLEAGAGYGKTEMIKAFKSKTLLVLPFTSTIKAKVESSDTTKDWLYFYGNKRPTIDDLFSGKSMSMTIDKFSHLNLYELDQADFKYIVIDESHLLFTSSYREVMSPAIQRIANCKAKVILMSGTPTGELLFFPGIKHIKVIKDDYREKSFDVNFVQSDTELMIEMCRSMARDIKEHRKILYPTNKGNLHYMQITGLISKFLVEEFEYDGKMKSFYYKKSNFGDSSMDDININKTIGDNDLIMCTTYLSVGVDITDNMNFSIYFDEQWIPQDLEQFANRLRNNNLHIHMYLPKTDSTGMPINYYFTQPLNLSFSDKDMLFARDLIQTCNDMLERNEEEAKYNPLISSLLSANKYLKYDENDCKYYIDETTYKLNVFEERYKEYSKQLTVMLNGIRYYGYTTNIIDHKDTIPLDKIELVRQFIKDCKHSHMDYKTQQTFIFLNHINDNNIDFYRDLLKGSYEIFRGSDYKEERENNNLYIEDIEIMEKNLPIVLSLYKYYSIDTIKEIYKFCLDSKHSSINYAKLNRIRSFVNIEATKKQRRLDFPIMRFIHDAKEFAEANPTIERSALQQWLATYAARYANSVKNVVVNDVDYLREIYELITALFKVVVVITNSKGRTVILEPFTLLWEQRQTLNSIYGDMNTQTFFLQELEDELNKTNDDEPDEMLPELTPAPKLQLSDVQESLKDVVHSTFDYKDYSTADNSNNRFLRKQENTNTLRDRIFGNTENNKTEEKDNVHTEPTLFDNDEQAD